MNSLIELTIKKQYFLHSLIGRGRKTEIYKAWDNIRNAQVALKLLHVDLDSDQIDFSHLLMEARILASLTAHTNIVRFYELGQDGEFVFIVMNYIDGVVLKNWLYAEEKMPFGDVLVVLRHLCGALHFMHSKGVVHADIKPNNIIIAGVNDPVIIDFSVARLIGAFSDVRGVGTPRYMSPEQVLGNLPVPQSDIYSLGVILYETISGETPFNGNSAPFDGLLSERIKWEKINLLPPPLKNKKYNISSKLEAVINKALSVDPVDRYSNMLEFLDAIESSVSP